MSFPPVLAYRECPPQVRHVDVVVDGGGYGLDGYNECGYTIDGISRTGRTIANDCRDRNGGDGDAYNYDDDAYWRTGDEYRDELPAERKARAVYADGNAWFIIGGYNASVLTVADPVDGGICFLNSRTEPCRVLRDRTVPILYIDDKWRNDGGSKRVWSGCSVRAEYDHVTVGAETWYRRPLPGGRYGPSRRTQMPRADFDYPPTADPDGVPPEIPTVERTIEPIAVPDRYCNDLERVRPVMEQVIAGGGVDWHCPEARRRPPEPAGSLCALS